MEMIVDRKKFGGAMKLAAAVSPLRGVRPSLRNTLVRAGADGLVSILATDMEIGMRTQVRAESVKAPFEICLPAATLAGIADESSSDQISLTLSGAKAHIVLGRDVYDICGTPVDDFPEIQGMDAGETLSFTAADLARMIELTAFAVAREQGRYAINGILLRGQAGQFYMVATDGRRMAVYKRMMATPDAIKEGGVIVPPKMAKLVAGMCADADPNAVMQIAQRSRQFVATDGTTCYSALVIEDIYPKFEGVLPKGLDKEISFNADAMAHALSKAHYMISKETNAVSMRFSKDECQLDARAADVGTALVHVLAEYSGPATEIRINPDYLIDVLKCFKEESLRLEMKDLQTPVMIRVGKDFTYVLMQVTSN